MDEEIQIINEKTKKEKVKKFFIRNGKYLISSVSLLVILILVYFIYVEIKARNQIKIAEKYHNTINNFQSLNNNEKIKKVLVEIIETKNPTYSPLALYFIIDNDLEIEKNNINEYFDKVISINSLEKEIKNLNIYKKAVFNSDFVNEIELIEILRPITNSDSVWKSHSLLLLSEYFYFKKNKAESKKLLNEILNYEGSNPEIKIEAKKKLIRDFSE